MSSFQNSQSLDSSRSSMLDSVLSPNLDLPSLGSDPQAGVFYALVDLNTLYLQHKASISLLPLVPIDLTIHFTFGIHPSVQLPPPRPRFIGLHLTHLSCIEISSYLVFETINVFLVFHYSHCSILLQYEIGVFILV